MSLKALFLALTVTLVLPHMTVAQEAWPETEVVVRGKAAVGPALWRVTKGDSQVIILGILPVFPKKQTWSTKRIEGALRGANRLITPADSSTGIGDAWMMMSKKGLPNRQSLKDAVPTELYSRYETTAKRAGVPIKDFARDKPVKAAGRYDMGPIFKAVNAMDDKASQACLRYTLDDIDFNLDRAPLAAKAWAVGDIATVRRHYQGSTLLKCLSGSPQATAMMDRAVSDSARAVTTALNKPGKTVAVFPLALLLRKGGVLDHLRAQGYDVSNPKD